MVADCAPEESTESASAAIAIDLICIKSSLGAMRHFSGWIVSAICQLLNTAKLLGAATEAHFGGVEIAFGIDRDVVHPFELSGLASVPTPGCDDLAVLAQQCHNLAIGAVGHENVALC